MTKHAHDEAHGVRPDADLSLLLVALGLLSAFVVGEVVAAWLGRSLVLLADAGHMVTDVVALATSAWAIQLAKRPAHGRWTYGLKRAEIISAAVNGATLVAVAFFITVEAIDRLVTPDHVVGGVLVATAGVGAVVNLVAVRVLSRANRTRLTIRAAYVHVMTDLYSFVGTAIAGVVILTTGWNRADAVAALLVVVLMIRTAWGLLRDSGAILLQATPDHLDLEAVRTHLAALEHVVDVHDLHAWTVTSGDVTLAAHVVTRDECFVSGAAPRLLDELQKCLSEHFEIEHATFQLEPASHAAHEEGLHP